jgi:hypothetical protein
VRPHIRWREHTEHQCAQSHVDSTRCSPLLDFPPKGDHGFTLPQPQRCQFLLLSLRQTLPDRLRPLERLQAHLHLRGRGVKVRATAASAAGVLLSNQGQCAETAAQRCWCKFMPSTSVQASTTAGSANRTLYVRNARSSGAYSCFCHWYAQAQCACQYTHCTTAGTAAMIYSSSHQVCIQSTLDGMDNSPRKHLLGRTTHAFHIMFVCVRTQVAEVLQCMAS